MVASFVRTLFEGDASLDGGSGHGRYALSYLIPLAGLFVTYGVKFPTREVVVEARCLRRQSGTKKAPRMLGREVGGYIRDWVVVGAFVPFGSLVDPGDICEKMRAECLNNRPLKRAIKREAQAQSADFVAAVSGIEGPHTKYATSSDLKVSSQRVPAIVTVESSSL
ncbi:hypothetical protein ACLOAV_004510 [Pseudogymnoascus australis]